MGAGGGGGGGGGLYGYFLELHILNSKTFLESSVHANFLLEDTC